MLRPNMDSVHHLRIGGGGLKKNKFIIFITKKSNNYILSNISQDKMDVCESENVPNWLSHV